MIVQKECPICYKPIKGRTDKKFCSDSCRNTFNNTLNATRNAYLRAINHRLLKNRRILEELVIDSSGTRSIPKKQLIETGFSFLYHTHTFTTRKGNMYYFCYDYGYLELENDILLLVKDKKAGKRHMSLPGELS